MNFKSKDLIKQLESVLHNNNESFIVQYLSVFEFLNEQSCTLLMNKDFFFSEISESFIDSPEPVRKYLKKIVNDTLILESNLNRLIERCEKSKKEGLEPIEVPFLQDMARDILAIPDRGLIDKTISKDSEKM